MMRRLSKSELAARARRIEEASYGGLATFEPVADEYRVKAIVEFPLGELLEPKISAYVEYWRFAGLLQTAPIRGDEGFIAQGLEGKAVVRTDLVTAILVWRALPEYRCSVLVKD